MGVAFHDGDLVPLAGKMCSCGESAESCTDDDDAHHTLL
jgi:hypothetical protein